MSTPSIPETAVGKTVRTLRARGRKLRGIARRARRALHYEISAFWRRRQVAPNVVFYESFAGNGMLCNPEAIFRALRADPEFAHLTHIWSLRSRRENPRTVREFRGDRSVRFVRPGSFRYLRALATSGYLINNATFPPEFGKREGQLYLNTWHGTPLKKMGYDIGDPASRVANVIRNFLMADYLLSANHFMTERMYEGAHLLREIYRGRFIEAGYPRNDRQFAESSAKAETRSQLARDGVSINGRTVVLYAPTWKGTNFNRPEDDIAELADRVAELESRLDPTKYVVLLKTHQVVHRFASSVPGLRGRLVSNEIPTNAILAITDLLVTDYSSIFFDFLTTGRPIFFLAPDIADYAGYRGLYLEPETWPGPVTASIDQLATEILALEDAPRSDELLERYASARRRFSSLEDGHATERVIDIVFRGRIENSRILTATTDDRTTILINGGGLRSNGITTSLLNLLNAIDHSRFDVSVVFPVSRNRRILDNQRRINPAVRQFARVGGMNGSKLSQLSREITLARGGKSTHRGSQRDLWDAEWTRCFGSTRFDHVIDFSGYSPFWSTLLLHAPGSIRSIWLHNDLRSDLHRNGGAHDRMFRDLRSIFELYTEFDHLVSVSPSLATVNADSLAEYADRSKFVSAVNLINAPQILQEAKAEFLADSPGSGDAEPAWLELLREHPSTSVFISVGRLSPEKNQARLIRAFAVVHAKRPMTALVLVGAGPLEHDLRSAIDELGLGDSVWLAGHRSNPHALMAAADCFVLSSDYEGQPMVLLEAAIIGLPIVTVDFATVADALPAGGRVVPSTVDGLAAGMVAYLDGEVRPGSFDADDYNRRAVAEFVSAIGA